jgi:hypothetical protein
VDFVIRYFFPIFKYFFFAGLIGSVPVIIITAIKTAESMLEKDPSGQTGSGS